MLPLVFAAWAGHTEQSRAFAQMVERHRRACDLKEETLADALGLSRARLAHQLTAGEPLNVYRLVHAAMIGALPSKFVLGVFSEFLAHFGAHVLEPEDVQLLKGAVALGRKRMARMLAPITERTKAS